MDKNEKPKAMGHVIQIDEARIRDHLGAITHHVDSLRHQLLCRADT